MYQSGRSGNLSGAERIGSAVFGIALPLLVLRTRSPWLRSLAATAGAGLLARAVAGHCAVKAAVTGKSSIGEGFRDQWRMMSGRRPEISDTEEYVEQRADPVAVQEEVARPGA